MILPRFPTLTLEWFPSYALWAKFCEVYGEVFVRSECAKALLWLECNPSRLKTVRGMPRFLNNWLSAAHKESVKFERSRPTDAWMSQGGQDMSPEDLEAVRTRVEAAAKRNRESFRRTA
jgi:hypothetical protein